MTIEPLYTFEVLLPAQAAGLRHDSKAHAEQVRSGVVRRPALWVPPSAATLGSGGGGSRWRGGSHRGH